MAADIICKGQVQFALCHPQHLVIVLIVRSVLRDEGEEGKYY